MASKGYTLKDGTKLTERRAKALLGIYMKSYTKGMRISPNLADWLTEHHFVNRGDIWFGKMLCKITDKGIAALRELGLIEAIPAQPPAAQPEVDLGDTVAEMEVEDSQPQPVHKFKVGDRVRITSVEPTTTGMITAIGERLFTSAQRYLVLGDDDGEEIAESERDLEFIEASAAPAALDSDIEDIVGRMVKITARWRASNGRKGKIIQWHVNGEYEVEFDINPNGTTDGEYLASFSRGEFELIEAPAQPPAAAPPAFKVGDKVRVTSQPYEGCTGEIVPNISTNWDYAVQVDEGDELNFDATELELVKPAATPPAAPSETTAKFAVGDKVVMVSIVKNPNFKPVVFEVAMIKDGRYHLLRPDGDPANFTYAESDLYPYSDDSTELAQLQADLAAGRAEIEALREKLHKAVKPYIAGGSEYTGDSGLMRAIRDIGDMNKTVIKQVIRRKEVEARNAALVAALEFYASNDTYQTHLNRDEWMAAIEKDRGAKANEALKAAKKGADHE